MNSSNHFPFRILVKDIEWEYMTFLSTRLFSIDLNAVKARGKESFPLIVRDSMNSINVIPTIYNTFIGIGFYENELFRLFNDKGSRQIFL